MGEEANPPVTEPAPVVPPVDPSEESNALDKIGAVVKKAVSELWTEKEQERAAAKANQPPAPPKVDGSVSPEPPPAPRSQKDPAKSGWLEKLLTGQ